MAGFVDVILSYNALQSLDHTGRVPDVVPVVVESMNDISGVIGVARIIPSLTALQSKDQCWWGHQCCACGDGGGCTCSEWGC